MSTIKDKTLKSPKREYRKTVRSHSFYLLDVTKSGSLVFIHKAKQTLPEWLLNFFFDC